MDSTVIVSATALLTALLTAAGVWRSHSAENRKARAAIVQGDHEATELLLAGHGNLRVALLEEIARLRVRCENLEQRVRDLEHEKRNTAQTVALATVKAAAAAAAAAAARHEP